MGGDIEFKGECSIVPLVHNSGRKIRGSDTRVFGVIFTAFYGKQNGAVVVEIRIFYYFAARIYKESRIVRTTCVRACVHATVYFILSTTPFVDSVVPYLARTCPHTSLLERCLETSLTRHVRVFLPYL